MTTEKTNTNIQVDKDVMTAFKKKAKDCGVLFQAAVEQALADYVKKPAEKKSYDFTKI